jgi:hypothetical protein
MSLGSTMKDVDMKLPRRPRLAPLAGVIALVLVPGMAYGVVTGGVGRDLGVSRTSTLVAQRAAQYGPGLAVDCQRIAVTSDGSTDDIGASALALTVLAKQGQQGRLVHWDFRSRLDRAGSGSDSAMVTATTGTASMLGYDVKNIFRDSSQDQAAAADHLKARIGESKKGNRLCILVAGPLGVVHQALVASGGATSEFITLISHSTWNETQKDATSGWGLAEVRRDFPTVQYKKIPDQNSLLGPIDGMRKWAWMMHSPSRTIRELHRIIDVLENDLGDASDAGMMYYAVTGDEQGDAPKMRILLENKEPTPTPTPTSGLGPKLAVACTRLAVSSDGNYHDEDDIGASAMALALLAEQKQQDRLVHWDFNAHLGKTLPDRERKMMIATMGTGRHFGFDKKSVFWEDQANLDASVSDLRAKINGSTPTNRLCILGAGPMGVIYRALVGSDMAALENVTLVSHSDWNNEHNDDNNRWNLADIRRDFPAVKYQRIPDQNAGLGTGGGMARWSWMKSSSDQNLNYVHNVIERLENKDGDVSDAGMTYYAITGDQSGDAIKFRTFLTK